MNRGRLRIGCALLSLLLVLGSCHSVRRLYQTVYIDETGHRFVGTTTFRKARIRWHPYRLQLTTLTGTIDTRPANQVWGLQQTNGPRYRLYRGAFYEEIDGHQVPIYREADLGGSGQDRLYFSLTPTSPLLALNRRNLELVGLSSVRPF